MTVGTWAKLALIATILYVAGILVPLAAFVFAVQRDLVLAGYRSGNVILLGVAVAAAFSLGLFVWLRRLAERV